MKRLSITRGFLVIIIVCSILLGSCLGYVLIRQNVFSFLSTDKVSISSSEYDKLLERYRKYEDLDNLRNEITDKFYIDVDEEQLDVYTLKGLVAGLGDQYSTYYTAEEYEDISISLKGEYSGVGITMMQGDEYVVVHSVTRNSPAEKAGVTEGEYIIAVDGVLYAASEMDQCAAAVRGEKGTSVTITFIKDGEQIDRTIVRDQIFTETVSYETLDDNIGYIWLYGFESGSYDDFVKALDALKGTDGLILDLRDNPGGIVDSALNIADLFMDNATLFYTEDHDKNREYYYTSDGTSWDKPLVLIVNENTASAAEIFSAGLQDNERVKIVGVQSFGKGVIQSLETFTDGSALKLTMWQYFSPKGNAVNNVGVTPDVVVELDVENTDEEGYLITDNQLDAAIELIKTEIN